MTKSTSAEVSGMVERFKRATDRSDPTIVTKPALVDVSVLTERLKNAKKNRRHPAHFLIGAGCSILPEFLARRT